MHGSSILPLRSFNWVNLEVFWIRKGPTGIVGKNGRRFNFTSPSSNSETKTHRDDYVLNSPEASLEANKEKLMKKRLRGRNNNSGEFWFHGRTWWVFCYFQLIQGCFKIHVLLIRKCPWFSFWVLRSVPCDLQRCLPLQSCISTLEAATLWQVRWGNISLLIKRNGSSPFPSEVPLILWPESSP